jgi:hypothetical protein
LEAVYNINNYAFELYQNGNFKDPATCNAQNLIARSAIYFTSSDNTDLTYICKNAVQTDVTDLALRDGDNGSNSKITLPIPKENAMTDYVTVRAQEGIHHAFLTSGNYYYANSIVPSYTSLPTLTTLQNGGCTDLTFSNELYLTGYKNRSASFPIGSNFYRYSYFFRCMYNYKLFKINYCSHYLLNNI